MEFLFFPNMEPRQLAPGLLYAPIGIAPLPTSDKQAAGARILAVQISFTGSGKTRIEPMLSAGKSKAPGRGCFFKRLAAPILPADLSLDKYN